MRLAAALVLVVLASGQGQQPRRTFAGVISDDMCALGDHSRMKMGPTNGECAIACVQAHGALYVLTDGKDVYPLSDQQTPEKFAGKTVNVTGSLNGDTLQVVSIAAAPAKAK